MLKINRLRVEIQSDKSEDIDSLYGFDLSFSNGLNIIAGPNSRGKTTINSCIYFSLGMEELLGSQNEKALDKALKEEFTTIDDSGNEVDHNVIYSRVLLEISNETGVIVTIIRYIKAPNTKIKTSNVSIFNGGIDSGDTQEAVYYVNGRGNNNNENGFYVWLADFIDISIPQVSNNSTTSSFSPLYLQTIFSALFIEQTKGWSDFFATMPFFGIPKAKEKNVEFLLKLNELLLSVERDVLNRRKNDVSSEWNKTLKSFEVLERQFNGKLENLPHELSTEKALIDKINIWFSISEGERISLADNIASKVQSVKEFEDAPLSTVKNNRQEIIAEYNKQRQEYAELKEYISDFELKLELDNIQYNNIQKQLVRIIQEIKDHESLQKVFQENIISRDHNYCPTCTQLVSVDLISSNSIEIPKLSLEKNTNFLKSQRKIIDSSLNSLEETIKEKKLLLSYFNSNLRQKEILIKSISRDLIADDRAFSETQVVKKLQLEKEIENLNFIHDSIIELKNTLLSLADIYHNIIVDLKSLTGSEVEDEIKLSDFEQLYKELLFNFGYESNEKFRISINRKEPFKYFPVYKRSKEDTTPQSIRINSSASDFVRNIWAYTLSLLIAGVNHPGLVLFDEPGQHRTNIQSLKALFFVCSKIKEKQTIIFTSIDKQLNEKEKLDLNRLVEDLTIGEYTLIKLDNEEKVIQKLHKN